MFSGCSGDGGLSPHIRLRHFLPQSLPGNREDRQGAHRSHAATEQVCRRFIRSRTSLTPFSPLQNRFFLRRFFISRSVCGRFLRSRTGLPPFSPVQNRLRPFSPFQNRFSFSHLQIRLRPFSPLQNRFAAVFSSPAVFSDLEEVCRRFLCSRRGLPPFSPLQNRFSAVFSASKQVFSRILISISGCGRFLRSRTGLPPFFPLHNRLWPFSPLQNRFAAVFSNPEQIVFVPRRLFFTALQ